MKYLFILFFCTYAHSTEEEYPAHIMDHINVGCPTNSSCNSKTGLIRKQWSTIFKDNYGKMDKKIKKLRAFHKRYGLPINFWSDVDHGKDSPFVIWDSHCANHRKKKFYQAEAFVKTLKHKTLHSPELILYSSKNKYLKYKIPRNEVPSHLHKGKLHFNLHEDASYYGLLVDRKGNLTVTSPEKIKYSSEKSSCPKELVAEYKKSEKPDQLYTHFFCRTIWDKSSKSYKLFIMDWPCP